MLEGLVYGLENVATGPVQCSTVLSEGRVPP